MGKAQLAPVSEPGWYVETTADGGLHHGRLKDPDPNLRSVLMTDAANSVQVVESDCGRTFRPLSHAAHRGWIIRWERPRDSSHACRKCWTKVHGKNTSFYEIAEGGAG